MTVGKVKFQPTSTDLTTLIPDQGLVEDSNNNFNSTNVNPFTTDSKEYTAPKTTANGSKTNTFLFGNELVKENDTASKTETSELPKNSNVGAFSALSNYLKNTFKFAGDKVNEYDAAINNALKYLPSSGDMQILVESNPRIKAILQENGLPLKMNYDNLKTIKHTHIATTVEFARAIGEELGMSESEIQTMEIGAALHDTGKSLIPSEILNKNGRLDPQERKTINLHSVLGYEILKSAGYGVNVAEIARDHHNPNSTNKMAQIVRAADVYSAMREERPYKSAKTHEEAMAVLRDMKISSNILDALDRKYGTQQKQDATGFGMNGTQAAVA